MPLGDKKGENRKVLPSTVRFSLGVTAPERGNRLQTATGAGTER